MIKKLITAIALSFLFAAQANAASLTIAGPTEADPGESFQVTISGNFDGEGFIAGGITLFWDSALVALNMITLELPVTPSFSCPGSANCPAPTANSAPIVWGEFLNDLIPVDGGDTLMATLDFTALVTSAEAVAAFSMESNDGLTGGWFGTGFSSIDTPSFGDFQMEINTAVVPLPAAVWFMVGGLGTLLGFRRK